MFLPALFGTQSLWAKHMFKRKGLRDIMHRAAGLLTNQWLVYLCHTYSNGFSASTVQGNG
jgi:hypothetical protein